MKGDADKVAASLDTSAIVNSAVDEVFSSTAETHAVLSEYLKTHPDVTESQVKAKARASLDQEIREHVEAGTLPKRIPLGSSSLKALAAQAYARGSVRSVKRRRGHRARGGRRAVQGEDPERQSADATRGRNLEGRQDREPRGRAEAGGVLAAARVPRPGGATVRCRCYNPADGQGIDA